MCQTKFIVDVRIGLSQVRNDYIGFSDCSDDILQDILLAVDVVRRGSVSKPADSNAGLMSFSYTQPSSSSKGINTKACRRLPGIFSPFPRPSRQFRRRASHFYLIP